MKTEWYVSKVFLIKVKVTVNSQRWVRAWSLLEMARRPVGWCRGSEGENKGRKEVGRKKANFVGYCRQRFVGG